MAMSNSLYSDAGVSAVSSLWRLLDLLVLNLFFSFEGNSWDFISEVDSVWIRENLHRVKNKFKLVNTSLSFVKLLKIYAVQLLHLG